MNMYWNHVFLVGAIVVVKFALAAVLKPHHVARLVSFTNPEAAEYRYTVGFHLVQSKAAIGGPALFLDIHGHGDEEQWAWLGYLILGSDLDKNNLDPEKSSIRSLHAREGGSFEDLVRGSESFGSYLQQQGFRSVPSPARR